MPPKLDERGVKTKYGLTLIRVKSSQGCQVSVSQVHPNNRHLLEWNSFVEPFLSRDIPSHGNLPKFHIHLMPILYLGPVTHPTTQEIKNHETIPEVLDYFIDECRVQLGAHVFINRHGSLTGHYNFIAPTLSLDRTSPTSTTIVYPVIRCRADPLPPTPPNPPKRRPNEIHSSYTTTDDPLKYTMDVVIGLFFRFHEDRYYQKKPIQTPIVCAQIFDHNYNIGERAYRRRTLPPFNVYGAGNVWDITDYRLSVLNDEITPNRNRFAIYLCAGARLLVIDPYNFNQRLQEHNRSLVQQGGLVVVEHNLCICANNKENYNYITNDWVLTQLLTPEAENAKALPENPVIFLGANESEYNSSAWFLIIEREADPGTLRSKRDRAFLCMPEGGFIVAIEDWDVGMQEVLARHQYERLHLSNVHMANNRHLSGLYPFAAPDDDMLQRILGVGAHQHRGYDCNFRGGLNHIYQQFYDQLIQHRPRLPKQFNHRLCNELDVKFSPPVPPLYPLVKWNDTDYYWMPSQRTGRLLPFKDVWDTKLTSDRFFRFEGQNQFEYEFDPNDAIEKEEYLMRRFKSPDHFESSRALYDGINYRFGIDGWLYKKLTNPEIYVGNYMSWFYKRVDQ